MLQEENRTHDDAIKELEEKLQEENRMHDDAAKELEEKIADLEKQIKLSPIEESIPSETTSEPAQDMPEDTQESSIDTDDGFDGGLLHESARALSQEYEIPQEAPQETPKKRKHRLL